MAEGESKLEALRQTMPWSYMTQPNGVILLIDRNGQQVNLIDMLDFTCMVSQRFAK